MGLGRHVRTRGVTLVELLVVLAVIGIMGGLAVSLLPRQGIAISQAQRILSTAVQFARLEAIKQNALLRLEMVDGASVVRVVRFDDPTTVVHAFELDPQGGGVTLKAPSDVGIVFNSRGVAIVPVTRTVSIGVPGTSQFDVAMEISGQGAVRVAPEGE